MKIIAIIAGALGAAAVITVAVHVITPDNSKATEMQRQDIAAEREAIRDFQRTHPNPFKTE